ncbi:TIGR01244 family phosphatase [Halomonas sp. 328]|nr:TIGR01244 family phosphatase [Halomonas sp. 328]
MQLHELEPGLWVAPALSVDNLDDLARRGVKSVICNRRPGEAADHDAQAMQARAAILGIQWRAIPVTPGDYSDEDIAAFAEALAKLPRPLVAFCRTGRRATHLWAHARSQQPSCDLAVLLAAARKAGHDLEDRRALLEAAARQG